MLLVMFDENQDYGLREVRRKWRKNGRSPVSDEPRQIWKIQEGIKSILIWKEEIDN